jgi:hypothetical protein
VKFHMSFTLSFAVDELCPFVRWAEHFIYGTTVHATHLADLQQLERQPQRYAHSDCLVSSQLIGYEIC